MTIARARKNLLAAFEDSRLWKIGPFKASNGAWVPLAPNFRNFYSQPQLLEVLGLLMAHLIKQCKGVKVLIGMPYCGIPLTAIASLKSNIPMVYLRKKSQGTFSEHIIDGQYRNGARAALVDDAMTMGGQKVKSLKQIGQELKTTHILTIWDSDYPSRYRQQLIRKNIITKTIVHKFEVLKHLKKVNKIHTDTEQVMLAQTYQPKTWHKNKQFWQQAQTMNKRGIL